MKNYSNLTIRELQNLGIANDLNAVIELGNRVIDMDIDIYYKDHYCRYKDELEALEEALENEIPPECPNCGEYI